MTNPFSNVTFGNSTLPSRTIGTPVAPLPPGQTGVQGPKFNASASDFISAGANVAQTAFQFGKNKKGSTDKKTWATTVVGNRMQLPDGSATTGPEFFKQLSPKDQKKLLAGKEFDFKTRGPDGKKHTYKMQAQTTDGQNITFVAEQKSSKWKTIGVGALKWGGLGAAAFMTAGALAPALALGGTAGQIVGGVALANAGFNTAKAVKDKNWIGAALGVSSLVPGVGEVAGASKGFVSAANNVSTATRLGVGTTAAAMRGDVTGLVSNAFASVQFGSGFVTNLNPATLARINTASTLASGVDTTKRGLQARDFNALAMGVRQVQVGYTQAQTQFPAFRVGALQTKSA